MDLATNGNRKLNELTEDELEKLRNSIELKGE